MKNFEECPRLDVFKSWLVCGASFSDVNEFPLIKRTDFKPTAAIPFNLAKRSKDHEQWLHFYEYDYLFERVWNNPKQYLEMFKRFGGVITPDYSLYRDLPLAMQVWNTYRNRAIAYWLQNNGVDIVANVRWADERSYEFAFEGLEQGGSYAVCTNGGIRSKLDRYYFKKGLAKMVEVLKPDTIINYATKSIDIFEPYEKQGIEIITLNYWRDAFRKAGNL
ncbi:MAG: DUF4417 domain-containing protein [Defluviitaleaceae bacterium]|nr:DUF4417 domain-containing protein [Defluviitaleaceae bacterium]